MARALGRAQRSAPTDYRRATIFSDRFDRSRLKTDSWPEMPFIDILRSVDVLVTKPGYGSFTDAACNRVPVLFVGRPDWPEAPYLTDWLITQGRGLEIRQAQLATGDLAPSIADVLALPQPPALAPQGISDAADILSRWLA